ncbi:hypothetical protein ABBQ32_010025 [Trebouxia sp. C0010 RCD-2024]
MPGRAVQIVAAAAIALAAMATTLSGTVWRSANRTPRANEKVFECTKLGVGSRYTVVRSTKDTSGDSLSIRELVRAGSPGFTPGRSGSPPPHIHKRETECFIVHSGSFSYEVDGVIGHLKPGDTPACIPPGMTHQFWNSNNITDLDMQFTVTPAGNFESFIRTMCGLATDAGSAADINPLQMMVMFVGGGMEIAAVPTPVWLFIERIVVPLLRMLRIYQPTYPEYTV